MKQDLQDIKGNGSKDIKDWVLILSLAFLMGIIGGFSAVLLRFLIETITIFFLEIILPIISFYIGSFNIGYMFLPAIGGLLVGIIIHFRAKETKGSGIPYLLGRMALKEAHIKPQTGLYKTIVSSLTIGSGGNAGREGPIALIAASFGSFFGKKLKLKIQDKRLIMTCGLAAGIAGSFNAPLGGALFGLEILYQGVSIIGSIPVFLAAVIGSIVAGTIYGIDPTFNINFTFEAIKPIEYPFLLIFAVLIAFLAFFRFKIYQFIEKSYQNIMIPDFLKPALGGLITGIIIMFFPSFGFYGIGFEGIQMALRNEFTLLLLLLLGSLKILATANTIGSGGSGGIFAPLLYIGCMFGGAYGIFLHLLFPNLISNPLIYCLLGSAALFAASAQAPLNISIMIAEMAHNFVLLPPLLITSVISFLVGRMLFKGASIYTMSLEQDGIILKPDTIYLLENLRVHEVMSSNLITVSPELPILEFAQLSAQHNDLNQFPVMNFGKLEGIVFLDALYTVAHEDWDKISVKEIMSNDIDGISSDSTLQTAIDLMHQKNVRALLVTEKMEYENKTTEIILKGLLTLNDIVRAWEQKKSIGNTK
ncbi:chloride channel protein [Candidatus Lokiarchaeum ossiferum]|uniref:chloride channel protein n=1 Tax=Candidatus Lokiarchaeum ossiferum TaxID=2951803 RepID=UPI00352BD76C